MAYVYFSSIRPPHPALAKPLVSGVIEAESADAAKAKLQAALASASCEPPLSSSDDFTFADLAAVERSGNGFLVVTMAEG